MKRRHTLPAVALAATLALGGLPILAPAGPVAIKPAEAASQVTVTVRCEDAPETTTVKNNTNKMIKIKTVGSIHEPRDNEPFRVNANLKPRKSITFESGSGADSNKLTGLYIYDNDVGSDEGARVKTSIGTFKGRC